MSRGMIHRVRRPMQLLLLPGLSAAIGCGGPPEVSDTGYEGTWRRGNDRAQSVISIARADGGLRVRVLVERDGKPGLVCDWNGDCERRHESGEVDRYRFRSELDPRSGRLIVSYDITTAADPDQSERYVDEYVLEPDGRSLRVETVERNGETLPPGARPMRVFSKVDDRVLAPPGRSS